MILVIDNYDSFTWNLVDILRQGDQPVEVYRNDALTVEEAMAKSPAGILISPGPGRPAESGISPALARAALGKVPMLGVCLGHQLLGEMCGLKLVHAPVPTHGKTSLVEHDGKGIFTGMPQPFRAMRYHSLLLIAGEGALDSGLEITARTPEGEIMGIHHKFLNFDTVQFHPESILTEGGATLLFNWMYLLRGEAGAANKNGNSRVHR